MEMDSLLALHGRDRRCVGNTHANGPTLSFPKIFDQVMECLPDVDRPIRA
jgi:hypothetical protein